jgi:hypothetical protein
LLREIIVVAKKKPAPKKKTGARKAKAPKPATIVDASPELAKQGFYRGEYHWETDSDVPALAARVRLLVDHTNGMVHPDQARAVDALLASKQSLRPLALKAAYDCMLQWVEGYRQRHPEFRGKPIAEKPFTRGCELKSALFPTPASAETKPAPVFVLSLFWPDDNRPCEVRFERVKSAWVVTGCERN